MNNIGDIIVKPLVSEKGIVASSESNTYLFQVHTDATKIDVKRAVEKLFGVKVVRVNTVHVAGKKRQYGRVMGATKSYKKAYVKLAQGQSLAELYSA